MTEDTENLILRLLREIRGTQQAHSAKFVTIERRLSEMHEGLYTALGMAAHGNVVIEGDGGRLDEMAADIAAMKRRMAELESRT
jgi:hypothetical protein